jgi:cytosol alanyl aminopeptidase
MYMRVCILSLTLGVCAFADTADPPKFRLPATAGPVRYAIDLTIVPGEQTFRGKADIELTVKESAAVLWLSASDLTVESASLKKGGTTLTAKVTPGGKDFIGFAFDPPLAPGAGTLHVEYSGKIQSSSSAGIFQLRDGQNPAWYVYTQFEPTDARRAFPCFDEPRFKTPYQLTLHVKKEHLATSNSPIVSETPEEGGMKRVQFAPTRPLPSYLVAFAVGPFEVVDAGKGGRKGVPLRILMPVGHSDEAGFARAAIPELLKLLEAYFDSAYPYEKLDSVMMPISSFAMENAGMITYANSMLLSKPANATNGWQRGCATVAAHEMAHQWFGDLVTTAWWDDIWLNESFATWMEGKIVDQWKPEWKIPVSVAQSSLGVMGLDSLATTRRVRQPIESESDIANAFDSISYEKGSAVIGMFESWLGEKPFQTGVRQYMKQYADQAATTADFLAAISKGAGRDVTRAFDTFLDQPGVPLVTAELRCENGPPRLGLSQRRSLPIGSRGDTKQTWMVPICVKYPANGGVARECEVASDPSTEMKLTKAASCPAWVLANDGETGYYRVLYRGGMLNRLLADNGSRLTLAERVGVLGDVSALVNAGEVPPGDALALVEPFSKDPDWRIVSQTIGIAGMLRSNNLVPDELLPNAARFLRQVYGERAHQLGWNAQPGDSDDTKILRRQLVSLVASAGEDPELIEQAKALALKWLDDHNSVDPEIAGTVVSIAASKGDQALFDRLRADLHRTQERRQRSILIGAMASIQDPAIARQRMAIVLTDEFETREILGAFAFATGPQSRRLPFEFVKQNLDALLKKLPREVGGDYAGYLPSVGNGFCTAAERTELEDFFKPKVDQYSGGPRILAQTLERIDLCIARRQALGPSLAEFLKKY